jgi:hypothetical protein
MKILKLFFGTINSQYVIHIYDTAGKESYTANVAMNTPLDQVSVHKFVRVEGKSHFFGISLYHTLLRMRSQIGESIEESHRKIDVATHPKQSVINGYIVFSYLIYVF